MLLKMKRSPHGLSYHPEIVRLRGEQEEEAL
jgi:hypothetical protein